MIYDLIIVGSGPAGCSASIYASRYGLKNLLLGKTLGGTIAYAHKVDNYPGFWGMSGADLMQKIEAHVKTLGTEIIYDPVNKFQKLEKGFQVFTNSGREYQAKTVILACGTERRKLGIPGEKELAGRGVSYCVTCDAPFFKDKIVALVGGSDAACSGAVHLAQFVKKIYLIYRKGQLRAEPFWVAQWQELVRQGKGEFLGETNVVEILNKMQNEKFNPFDKSFDSEGRALRLRLEELRVDAERSRSIKMKNDNLKLKNDQELSQLTDVVGAVRLDKPYNGSEILAVDGIFIEIGGVPGTELAKSLGAKLDAEGYAMVNEKMETEIPGLFCAGDMADKSKVMQQVITAMASGAIAAASAYKFLKGQQAPQIRGI